MSRLAHWEIPSTNLGRSVEFYTSLFRWDTRQTSKDYAMFIVKEGPGGGCTKVDKINPSCIDIYFAVDDIPRTLSSVEMLGGKTAVEKTEIGDDMGYVETSEGKLIKARGVEGRYVRFYSKGNHVDGKNHYTEVEVFGIPAAP